MTNLLTQVETILTTALILGLLVFFHELGHFLVAKLFKFKVYEFALGLPLGRRLITFYNDGETAYTLRACPLGGFVGFQDADADEATRDEQMEFFNAKPVWQRFWVILAGPLASLLVGYLALAWFIGIDGMPVGKPTNRISIAEPSFPAAKAGLVTGDTILTVNGTPTPDGDALVATIRGSGGTDAPIVLSVKRNKTQAVETINVTPKVVDEDGKKIARIGIVPQRERRPASVGESFTGAGQMTVTYFELLIDLFRHKDRLKDSVGGPLGIVGAVGEAVKEGGIAPKIERAATLSLSLFFFNLVVPVPVFDGGQLVLLLVEAIRRRPLSKDLQMKVMIVGWVLVLALFATMTANDIFKLFRKS